MIRRQGPTGDVARGQSGETIWTVERPANPWAIEMGSFETYSDDELITVDGIRVHLALIPRENEKGVVIRLKNRELIVEPVGA